jgi:Na+-transporting NADH:ubiquinone oxidoreductase subunit NqrD
MEYKELIICFCVLNMVLLVYKNLSDKPLWQENTLKMSILTMASFLLLIFCIIDKAVVSTAIAIVTGMIGFVCGQKFPNNPNGKKDDRKNKTL